MEESPSRIHSHRPGLESVGLRQTPDQGRDGPNAALRVAGSGRLAALAVGALICAMAAAVAGAGVYLNRPPRGAPASGEARPFAIRPGETLAAVAQRLHGEGIIRSPLVFRTLARARTSAPVIQAGHFQVPVATSTSEVLALLVDGPHHLTRATIPEGWTSGRIATYLEEIEVTGAAEFLAAMRSPELLRDFGIAADSAEGYLFPDTYFFPREYHADAVVRHMVDNFFTRLHQIYPDYRSLDAASLHDTVTLASIVEREYRLPAEAAIIASVFYNRLNGKARLESCATIQYIITEVQGKEHPERILHADLEIDSPFNTYRRRGLPPAPIANPGLTALRAAFFPAQTDYWYFVVRDPVTGAHQFSTDLNAHSEARFLYLKGVAAAPDRAHT